MDSYCILSIAGIELMYLLDADCHPRPDGLERTVEVIEMDSWISDQHGEKLVA